MCYESIEQIEKIERESKGKTNDNNYKLVK